jgi:hypothetical protein
MAKIAKLPPGKAIGADDLQIWARQRNAGLSGVPDNRQQENRLRKRKRRRARWLRLPRDIACDQWLFRLIAAGRKPELNDMVRKTRNNESVASVLPIDRRTTNYVFGKLMFTKKPDDTDWRAMQKARAELEARLPIRIAVNNEAQRIWENRKLERYEHGKTKYQAIEFKPEKWDLGRDAAVTVTSPKKDEDAA